MQKELALDNNFKDWYQMKQGELGQDELLRWLVEARNHVVKEGDLKKFSYTKVRLKDHYDREIFAAILDAKIPMEYVAEWFRQNNKIPDEIKDYAIIEAERIWIVENFPKVEIVDVLIYCFGVLTNLVYLAHEDLYQTNALLCVKNKHISIDEDYMVKLHNDVTQGRIVRILYSSGEILTEVRTAINRPTEESMQEVAKRYPKTKQLIKLSKEEAGEIPFNKISYHVESAKQFMEVDGGILPVAFLYFLDKPPIIEILGMNRPADRYLTFEHLAKKVEETKCTAVITIAEYWRGDVPKKDENYIPASTQRKGEGVWVIAASPARLDCYSIEINRDKDNKPILGNEYHHKDVEQESMPSFSRIYNVWKNAEWAK